MTKLRTHLDGHRSRRVLLADPVREGLPVPARDRGGGRARARSRAGCAATSTTFRFGAITTEDFEAHIEAALPGALAAGRTRARWLDGEGCRPSRAPASSARLDAIEALGAARADARRKRRRGRRPSGRSTSRACRARRPRQPAARSTTQFHAHREHELRRARAVADARAQVGLPRGPAARRSRCVAAVGRMKYLRPLYTALAASDPRTRGRRGRAVRAEPRRLPPDRAPDGRRRAPRSDRRAVIC